MDIVTLDAVDKLIEAATGAAVILESLADDGPEGNALRLIAASLENRALQLADTMDKREKPRQP